MPSNQYRSVDDAFRYLGERLESGSRRANIYGYRPHLKQYQFHSSVERLKLYIGGNRSGKTVGGIVEDCLWSMGKHPYRETPRPPTRGRIISVDFKDGIDKIIKPELARWLPPSELVNGSWEDSFNREMQQLTLDNGSTIDFMSYEQAVEKFAGVSRDWIHFDEEPPKNIFTENLLRVADCGGSMWITMTPLLGMTWVFYTVYEPGLEKGHISINEEFPDLVPLSCRVIEVDITENPYLSETEVQTIISALDPEDIEARAHGKFVRLGGLIYKDFDPKVGGLHVLKESLIPPRDWLWVASLDHGYNNPTAWLYHGVNAEGSAVTFREHYQSGWVVEQHASRIFEINKELGRAPDIYIGDPTIRNTDPITGTSVHQEYVAHGVPIILGNNDVRAGIIRVASYLRPDDNGRAKWHITPDCVNTIREMKNYRWKTYANKKLNDENNLREEPHKKDDHTPDSLRYFIMSRPDLRAEKEESVEVNKNAIIGAPTGVPAIGAKPKDFLEEVGAFKTDYISGTEWVEDDVMGGEW